MRTEDAAYVARRLGLVLAAVVLAIVMSLASCGPGVGGTGDGNAPVPAAVADATVCSEDFGASLSCPAGSGGNVSVGTEDVTWSDANDQGAGATAGARFAGNNLALEEPCAQLRFDGRFARLEDGRRAFAGTYVDAASATPRAGFVFVSVVAGNTSALSLELVDADGTVRHGPWVLRADRTLPSYAACP